MHLREPRGKTGCCRVSRYFCCCHTNFTHLQTVAVCHWGQQNQQKSVGELVAELDMTGVYDHIGKIQAISHCKSHRKCLRQQRKCHHCGPDARGGSCHQTATGHSLLPTPGWEPKQLDSFRPPKTWGQIL